MESPNARDSRGQQVQTSSRREDSWQEMRGVMDRWNSVEQAAYKKTKNSHRCHGRRRRGLRHRGLRRRGLRLYGPFRLVDRVGSPRSLDPQDDGQDAPQVPIQLAAAAVVVGPCSSCLLYTSPSPRDLSTSRMPSSA